ncbi:16736_t:CDS:2 [Gigaspora margarita]|uniref:16736_t:CDS:1 n=1 Tax=Gigaspora margarita TaxID=4874 RepID=A0ABN7VBA0_GIGMA|nr:16736_t:CDS:2 [Gigaspora margarita]
MDYLCKSKLANTFPAMLHVSFDCLYSPKTDENLQKQVVKFIQWITMMVDTLVLKLIGKILLFGLLKIIKETENENLDLSIHSPEEDNENLKVVIIKFQEFNQLNQLDQWINEENIQEMEKILEENTDKHFPICFYLKED